MTKTVRRVTQGGQAKADKATAKTRKGATSKRTAPAAQALEDKPQDRDIGETAAAIADRGDHVRLLWVNGAVLGLGLVTRNARLIRTGVRMVIAQGLALGVRTLFAQGLHTQGEQSAEEASQGGSRRAGSKVDDGVATGSGAATVAVARAVSATTPIPYIPARLAGLAVTGRNTPRGANPVSDFMIGAAIGWLAERLATRLVGAEDRDDD